MNSYVAIEWPIYLVTTPIILKMQEIKFPCVTKMGSM